MSECSDIYSEQDLTMIADNEVD